MIHDEAIIDEACENSRQVIRGAFPRTEPSSAPAKFVGQKGEEPAREIIFVEAIEESVALGPGELQGIERLE